MTFTSLLMLTAASLIVVIGCGQEPDDARPREVSIRRIEIKVDGAKSFDPWEPANWISVNHNVYFVVSGVDTLSPKLMEKLDSHACQAVKGAPLDSFQKFEVIYLKSNKRTKRLDSIVGDKSHVSSVLFFENKDKLISYTWASQYFLGREIDLYRYEAKLPCLDQ